MCAVSRGRRGRGETCRRPGSGCPYLAILVAASGGRRGGWLTKRLAAGRWADVDRVAAGAGHEVIRVAEAGVAARVAAALADRAVAPELAVPADRVALLAGE